MTFTELAHHFRTIEETASRLLMTRELSDLFKKSHRDEIACIIYLLQGRVSPAYEKIDFGMAEKMLIRASIHALNIEKKTFLDRYKKVGDLGKTVEVFRDKITTIEEETLSVCEVFDKLKKMAQANGEGSQEVKIGILSQLIRTLDSLSCRYLMRIPVNTLRLGFSDMTILDAFSWMIVGDKTLRGKIEEAYHVRPDLGFIGTALKKEGIQGLKKVKPAVFTPILMMRAERLSSAKDIIEKIGRFAVESKYDGFRLQIHYKNDEVKLFSRNLDEVSYMYPDLVSAILKNIKATEVIYEGEAIGYNPKTGDFLPFQETVQRKRKYHIAQKAKEIPLKLFVFDLLYLDGENMLVQQFFNRRKFLSHIFKNNAAAGSLILMADEEIIDDPQRLEALFEKAVSKGLEGIIAKKLNGVYRAGAREWNWIKYKKSYSSKLQDTIDCLVMGYDFGKGKRTDFGIGAFLVGVYDEKKDMFVTVAKIGTGLTDEEWRTLEIKNQKLKIKNRPSNYVVDKGMECDVWLHPKTIVEIRADEITKSPVHTAGRVMKKTKTGKGEEIDIPGFALRFPRLERFREDKKPEDATSVKEIETMYKQQKIA